jgi:CRP-like cAMP-binding protein
MPNCLENSIISQLPATSYAFLKPHLRLFTLEKGEILFEPNQPIHYYYFPVSCALELSIDLEDGKSGATTVINMNSMYPLHLVGQTDSQNRATVSCSGACYRIPVWAIHEELRRSPNLLWILLQESVKLFEMATLESVCLRHHTLEQITAKLILMSMDNTGSSAVQLTHQEMANSIGARREGVTIALNKLKAKNFIATHRGGIAVLDRDGLEHCACKCYKNHGQVRQNSPPRNHVVI